MASHCISSNNSPGDYSVFRTKGGRLLEEGDYFKCLRLKGAIIRGGGGAINRGTAIIRGNSVLC